MGRHAYVERPVNRIPSGSTARAVLVAPGDEDVWVLRFFLCRLPDPGHPYRPKHRLYGQLADSEASDQARGVDVVGAEEFSSRCYGSSFPARYYLASLFMGCA
jgi:hypothetical protein